MAKRDVPVYMLCGFLESGKTSFLTPMLRSDFTDDNTTLLLVTEEGEEEFDLDDLARRNVHVEFFEEKEDFTREACEALEKKYHPDQVVLEYNGMWQVPEVEDALPAAWNVYQIVTVVNAETFDVYSKNMAQLMMQHVGNADMVVFNRCTEETAEALRCRNLKMLNRRAEMFLEYGDGTRSEPYDDGRSPFDLSQPRLDLADEDYGIWFVDAMDHPERYQDKLISFRGVFAKGDSLPKGYFACGRFAMVCCNDDTTYLGMLCKDADVKKFQTRDWVRVTGRLRVENSRVYRGKGPVLHVTSIEPSEAPQEELVQF